MVTTTGLVSFPRRMVSSTEVPRKPRMRSTAWARGIPASDSPFARVIISPTCRPASAAGDPGRTLCTMGRPFELPGPELRSATPMPPWMWDLASVTRPETDAGMGSDGESEVGFCGVDAVRFGGHKSAAKVSANERISTSQGTNRRVGGEDGGAEVTRTRWEKVWRGRGKVKWGRGECPRTNDKVQKKSQ
jgi:hypothetical protein